jgi:hypothetical protein
MFYLYNVDPLRFHAKFAKKDAKHAKTLRFSLFFLCGLCVNQKISFHLCDSISICSLFTFVLIRLQFVQSILCICLQQFQFRNKYHKHDKCHHIHYSCIPPNRFIREFCNDQADQRIQHHSRNRTSSSRHSNYG